MKHLKALENAYRALLSLDPIERLDFQSELAELRDAIAGITGDDIETVQEKFEVECLLKRRDKIMAVADRGGPQPYEFMGSTHYV